MEIDKEIDESRQGEVLIKENSAINNGKLLYLESYGCQMNFSDSEVVASGKPFSIRCGWGLLGRILDGLGRPIDGGSPLIEIPELEEWAVDRE